VKNLGLEDFVYIMTLDIECSKDVQRRMQSAVAAVAGFSTV